MSTNKPKQKRRSIRLPEYDYSQEGAYYITICAQDRRCLFGEIRNGKIALSEYGRIIDNWWQRIPERYGVVALDEYVIMPNHLHGIILINGDVNNGVGAIHELPLQGRIKRREMALPKIVGYFKMNSTKKINQIRNTPGRQVWQRNYYEHVIRNEKSLHKIREYVCNNPLYWAVDDENPERKIISRRVRAIHELPQQ